MHIGILGTNFGSYHAKLLKNMGEVESVTIWGRQADKLLKLKEELGVNIAESAEAIINDPQIQVIDICLPSDLHAKYASLALQAGKDVFCETPVCLEAADGITMQKVQVQTGKSIQLNQFIKFDPAYRYLIDAVHSGRYGRLLHLALRRETAPLWGDLGLERITTNLMIHELDLVGWLLKEPEIASVHGTKVVAGDRSLVQASFVCPETAISAEIVVSSAMPDTYPFTIGYEAYFEHAKLVYDESSFEDGKIEAALVEHGPAGKRQIRLNAVDPYALALEYALLCIETGESSILSLEHALKAMNMAIALRARLIYNPAFSSELVSKESKSCR